MGEKHVECFLGGAPVKWPTKPPHPGKKGNRLSDPDSLPKHMRRTRLTLDIVMGRNRRKANSVITVPRDPEYSTKQLSKGTWRDFERLFETHPAPGAYPRWWMHCHLRGPLAPETGT